MSVSFDANDLQDIVGEFSPSEELLNEGASTTVTEEPKKSKRRGGRKTKFKGNCLITCGDIWTGSARVPLVDKSISGVLIKCTHDVNCHAENEAWNLICDKGSILCFIAKEHNLLLEEGCNVVLGDIIKRGEYKGGTIKVRK